MCDFRSYFFVNSFPFLPLEFTGASSAPVPLSPPLSAPDRFLYESEKKLDKFENSRVMRLLTEAFTSKSHQLGAFLQVFGCARNSPSWSIPSNQPELYCKVPWSHWPHLCWRCPHSPLLAKICNHRKTQNMLDPSWNIAPNFSAREACTYFSRRGLWALALRLAMRSYKFAFRFALSRTESMILTGASPSLVISSLLPDFDCRSLAYLIRSSRRQNSSILILRIRSSLIFCCAYNWLSS